MCVCNSMNIDNSSLLDLVLIRCMWSTVLFTGFLLQELLDSVHTDSYRTSRGWKLINFTTILLYFCWAVLVIQTEISADIAMSHMLHGGVDLWRAWFNGTHTEQIKMVYYLLAGRFLCV